MDIELNKHYAAKYPFLFDAAAMGIQEAEKPLERQNVLPLQNNSTNHPKGDV